MKRFTFLNLMGFLLLSLLISSCGNNGILGGRNNDDDKDDDDRDTIVFDSNYQNQNTLQLNYTGGNVAANQNFNISVTNTTNVTINFPGNWQNIVTSSVPGNFVSTTCPTALTANQSCSITYVITNTLNLVSGTVIVNYQPNTGGVIQSTVNIPFNSNNNGNTGTVNSVDVSIQYNEPATTNLLSGNHNVGNCSSTYVNVGGTNYNGVAVLVEGNDFACYFKGPHANMPSQLYGENSPTDDPLTSELGNTGCPAGWNNYLGTDGLSGDPIIKTETTSYKSVSGWNIFTWDPTYQYGQVNGLDWSDTQPFGYACLGNSLCLTANQYDEVYARVTGVLCY